MTDFQIILPSHAPVISLDHPELCANRYGFESGRALKVNGTYHLFVSEMSDDPFWIKLRLAHWRSPDAVHWSRVSTLFESTGVNSPDDHRSSIWTPTPVFDPREDRWNLFYVAYRGPRPEEGTLRHMSGRIWRAIAQTPGLDGLGGPYRDVEIVLQQDAESEPWEGQQGPDSFFPYPVGDRWYAFYGGFSLKPWLPFRVGLATAPHLTGPWKRCPELSPSPIEPFFIENPIVNRLRTGEYVAVYDSTIEDPSNEAHYGFDPVHIGISESTDGIHWPRGRRLAILPDSDANWSTDLRTPLGLIDEGDDEFTLLFTARLKHPERRFYSVGMVRLRRGEY